MSDEDNVITEEWPDPFFRAAKRTNLQRDTYTDDWFVGHGKDQSCHLEGRWFHMVMFAAKILASENTKLVVEACSDLPGDLYQPDLDDIVYLYAQHTGAPYTIDLDEE